MDELTKIRMNRKFALLDRLTPALNARMIEQQPADARPFIVTPAPFPNYPAVGAAASVVVQYVVPIGNAAVVNRLAIVHVGGGYEDGQADIIWRVLINGAAAKGLHRLQSQVGSWAQPDYVQIVLTENDNIQVTVEIPAGAASPPPAGSTTGARLHGWVYPLSKVGN